MTFDIAKFKTTKFKSREEAIKVPELKQFFNEGEEVVWTVRGLTGDELAITNEATALNKNLSQLVDGIINGAGAEKIEAIKESLGLTDKTPDDIVRRITMLKLGSVAPVVDQQFAVRLADAFPTTFYNLTNHIINLTGKGKLGE